MVGNEMKINPAKYKAISFTRARVINPLVYSLLNKNSRKRVVLNTCSDLNWVDQVNYTVQDSKALHFVMRVLKKGKKNIKF